MDDIPINFTMDEVGYEAAKAYLRARRDMKDVAANPNVLGVIRVANLELVKQRQKRDRAHDRDNRNK